MLLSISVSTCCSFVFAGVVPCRFSPHSLLYCTHKFAPPVSCLGGRIRKATPNDASLLQTRILREGMNPRLGDISNFLLYELDSEVVGCGQVRPGEPGEVASLVVEKALRGKGIGTKLLDALVQREDVGRSLVLLCLTRTVGFYERHGFRVAQDNELPFHMRVERRLGMLVAAVVAPGNNIVGMIRTGEAAEVSITTEM